MLFLSGRKREEYTKAPVIMAKAELSSVYMKLNNASVGIYG